MFHQEDLHKPGGFCLDWQKHPLASATLRSPVLHPYQHTLSIR